MEREIEVKVLHIDLEEMEASLICSGAEKIGEEFQTNYLIDSNRHPIGNARGYLRLRHIETGEGERIECTFKEKKEDRGVRSHDEHTAHVDSVEGMLEIFALLGYDQGVEAKKHRISYRYKNCRMDLDRWDPDSFPEPYMEIEGPSAEAIDTAIESLHIDRKKVSTKSIRELKKSWNK